MRIPSNSHDETIRKNCHTTGIGKDITVNTETVFDYLACFKRHGLTSTWGKVCTRGKIIVFLLLETSNMWESIFYPCCLFFRVNF